MANSRPSNQKKDCQLGDKSSPKLREAVGNISNELTDERSRLLKKSDGNTVLLQNIATESMNVTINQRIKNACTQCEKTKVQLDANSRPSNQEIDSQLCDACTECEKTKVQLEEVELERSFFERILNKCLTTLDAAVESMGPVKIKLPRVPKLANTNRRRQIKEDRKSVKDKLKRITDRHNKDAQRIKILLRENDEMKRKVEETKKTSKQKEEEHIKWVKAMEKMTTDVAKYEKALTKSLQIEEEYKKRLKEEERKTKDAEEAKLEALTRLNQETGTKLNDNNPAIADLSDPNRATKLAEMYSEIFDNEWTDALEEIDNYGYTEEMSIRLLLDIEKKADEFCKKKAEDQLKNIEDSFFMSNAGEDKGSFQNKKNIMKMLKDHRKSTAEKNAERIYKDFSTRHDQKYGISAEYVKKVVKLCWLMAVQDPPVCLGNEANACDKLDKDIFKPYTQTGTMVSYTVWLPMFLHEGGPLLSKGVAQPVSTRPKTAPTSRTNGHRNDKKEVKSRPTSERYTAAENHILQTKHDWDSLGETRRNQNYEMDFKHQKTTKEDVVKSYAPQPKVAWEPTHGYYNYKYHDQYHDLPSESHHRYDTNRSQFNTGVVTNAHTSYRSPNITYTKTQYDQSTVPTRTHRSDVYHKNLTQWR